MNQTVIIVIAVISVLVIAGVIVFFVLKSGGNGNGGDDGGDGGGNGGGNGNGGDDGDGASGASGETFIVKLENNSFTPDSFTIKKGDTVQWDLINGINHSVVSTEDVFDSGILTTSRRSWLYKFNTEGTFNYYCPAHEQFMTGAIIVE